MIYLILLFYHCLSSRGKNTTRHSYVNNGDVIGCLLSRRSAKISSLLLRLQGFCLQVENSLPRSASRLYLYKVEASNELFFPFGLEIQNSGTSRSCGLEDIFTYPDKYSPRFILVLSSMAWTPVMESRLSCRGYLYAHMTAL